MTSRPRRSPRPRTSRGSSSTTSSRGCARRAWSRAGAAPTAATGSRGRPAEIAIADVIRAIDGPLANVGGRVAGRADARRARPSRCRRSGSRCARACARCSRTSRSPTSRADELPEARPGADRAAPGHGSGGSRGRAHPAGPRPPPISVGRVPPRRRNAVRAAAPARPAPGEPRVRRPRDRRLVRRPRTRRRCARRRGGGRAPGRRSRTRATGEAFIFNEGFTPGGPPGRAALFTQSVTYRASTAATPCASRRSATAAARRGR